MFMDLDSDWLLSGSQLIADDEPYSIWDGYDVPVSTQISGYVTIHTPTNVFESMDYNMESDSSEKSSILEDASSVLVEHFTQAQGQLPGFPEMGYVTDVQLRQCVMQLDMVPDMIQCSSNIRSTAPSLITTEQQDIDWKPLQSISPTTSVASDEYGVETWSDEAVATVPECEDYAEDVLELLNQLSDTMDDDMYIDPVELEAFISFPLHPVSPDDVESLVSSSQLLNVDTQVTKTASSSFYEPRMTPIILAEQLSSQLSDESFEISSISYGAPVVEKKRKKQDQNKSAALRYRQKKRHEHGSVMNECEELESRNIELKTRVTEMTKEIDYLKGLIQEICTS